MGAGALGGYFGARLARAGNDVWLVARGAHLEAIRRDGLRVISPRGDVHLPDIPAVEDPAEIGPVDIVLFMVKNRDVESAARAIQPILRPDTVVVTCQNGISAWERLGAVIGESHVLPGVARIPGEVSAPGVIRHAATLDMLIFGEPDGSRSARCEWLAELLAGAGTTPVLSERILHELWSKFCAQSSLASLTTLTGLDVGPLRENEASARLFRDAISEAWRVGRAAVPDLPDTILDENWAFITALPREMHASMLDDLRREKPLENEYLSGDVARLGRRVGVPTPIHDVLYAALKPTSDRLEQEALAREAG